MKEKKWVLKNQNILYIVKMSHKTLKFGNVIVNKKEFHASKPTIALNWADTDKIIASHKFRYNDNDFKDFCRYKKVNIIRTLCIILSQYYTLILYTKYFDDG